MFVLDRIYHHRRHRHYQKSMSVNATTLLLPSLNRIHRIRRMHTGDRAVMVSTITMTTAATMITRTMMMMIMMTTTVMVIFIFIIIIIDKCRCKRETGMDGWVDM